MVAHAVHKQSHTYAKVTSRFPDGRHFLDMSYSHMCFHQCTSSSMLECFDWKKRKKNILRDGSWLRSIGLLISWEWAKTFFCFEIWVRSSGSPGVSRMTCACWQHDSPAIKSERDRQVHQRLGNLVERRGALFTSQVRRDSCRFPRSIAGLIDPGWQNDPFTMPKRPTSI